MKRITRLAGATFVAGALLITPRVDAATSYVHPETMVVFTTHLHAVNAQYMTAFARVRAAESLQARLQQKFVAATRRNLLGTIHSTHVGTAGSVYAGAGAPGTNTSIAAEYQVYERYLQMLARARSASPQSVSGMTALQQGGFWLQKAAVLFRASQSVDAMFAHSVTKTSLLLEHDLSLVRASARAHAMSQVNAEQQRALLADRARVAMEQEWGLELQQMNAQLQSLLRRPPIVA